LIQGDPPVQRQLQACSLFQGHGVGRTSVNALKTAIIKGHDFSAARLLAMAMGLRYEAILQLPLGSIAIRRRYQNSPSETSFLVQANDVVGNFATTFHFADIHPTSAGRTRKPQRIFQNVW
jgi:hypothetical protein